MSVNELAEHVGKPAPSASQHPVKLRMARLVRTRREGTTICDSMESSAPLKEDEPPMSH